MSAETAAILEEAANVIRRNGWCQGAYFVPEANKAREDCRVCAVGAINVALHKDAPVVLPSQVDTWRIAEAVEYHLGLEDLVDWNDNPDRTAEQVIAALEGAARAEREAAS